MERQPFRDMKILDLSNHISGSFCTKFFADYGADVIKVEKPGRGSLTRYIPPFIGNNPDINKSAYFLYLNTNKRGITLNLKSNTGCKIFSQLVRDVDILVESFAPCTSLNLGLDFDEIEKLNPRLIMASISNFGRTGPYRDFKASFLVEYAMGGAMYSTGLPEREPLTKGPDTLLFETGIQSAYVILAAYMVSRKDGIGDHIDISIMESQLAGCERRTANLLTYQYTKDISRRVSPNEGVYSTVPCTLPCKDGFVSLSVGVQNFSKFLTLIGRPDLVEDPCWDANIMEINPEVMKVYHDCFAKKTKKEWADLFQKENLICTPLNTPEDICNNEQWHFRNFFVDIEHPLTGSNKYPRGVIRVQPEWWKIRKPAPLLGQHNVDVYGALGYTADEIEAFTAQGIV